MVEGDGALEGGNEGDKGNGVQRPVEEKMVLKEWEGRG